MTYLEWNNIVSAYFFNAENDGKDVRLYASKADIIRVGRSYFCDSGDNFIWNDFIKSIRNGLPGSPGNVIENARYAFDKRNFLRIDSINVEFPPYITYLVILVIPLIEGSETPFSDNNYYDRLNEFLESNQINNFVSTNDFRLNRINELWKHLEDWANNNKNGSLGIFKTHLFTNERWVYVGRIFSQCILPPKAIKRLPELFAKSGMLPGSVLEYSKIRRILVEYGLEILQLPEYAINAIKSERNEFGKSVIAIVHNAFDQWTGECHQYGDLGDKGGVTKEFTVAKLFLQFKINRVSESVSFSFRLFSTNTYPDDLQFGTTEVLYERNGWSRPINTSLVDSVKLTDEHNKWAAMFFSADVQIFVNAGIHQLSSDYWIETDSLSKIDKMYLLCRDNLKRQSIIDWGESFDKGDFAHEDVDGLPTDYSLFRIRNPKRSHPSILNLIIPSEKKIGLTGGLRVNFRTYISDYLPEVEIINCEGGENVVLVYKESGTKICLQKCEASNNRWLLPKDCLLNVDFYTRVDGSTVDGDEIAYSLVSSNYSYAEGEGKLLPKRNPLDKIVIGESSQYCLGNNIINYGLKSKIGYSPYSHFFLPPNADGQNSLPSSTFSRHSGNMLAGYLATKGKFSAEDFFEAFEYYYLKGPFDQDRHVDYNFTSLKKASLSFYSALGIVDFDSESKKGVISPSELIFIPTIKGRKVLLAGARDCEFVSEIIKSATDFNLHVDVKQQFASNSRLLLPDSIIISAFGGSKDNYGEKKLVDLAARFKVKVTTGYLPQVALFDFSGSLIDYDSVKTETAEGDYGWARSCFNASDLKFYRDEHSPLKTSLALVEYKLNEYTYYCRLWENERSYDVDKNWGRYLFLKRLGKDVILYDEKNMLVAIPVGTPLPRLLAKSILLLSGLAPHTSEIDSRKYRIYANIPGVFAANLFKKLGQNPINRKLI